MSEYILVVPIVFVVSCFLARFVFLWSVSHIGKCPVTERPPICEIFLNTFKFWTCEMAIEYLRTRNNHPHLEMDMMSCSVSCGASCNGSTRPPRNKSIGGAYSVNTGSVAKLTG